MAGIVGVSGIAGGAASGCEPGRKYGQFGKAAPQAAGVIHTDFEKGFIKAEVYSFEDFKTYGSEAGIKAAGKYRVEGRDYVVQDGDVIFFKFNVTK